MSHWLFEDVESRRQAALIQIKERQVQAELGGLLPELDLPEIEQVANALEFAVLDLLLEQREMLPVANEALRTAAADAFRLLRGAPIPEDGLSAGRHALRAACLAVLGDMGQSAARWLREIPWPDLPLESPDWRTRTWASVIDVWIRLVRKDGWADRDAVLERISTLRSLQSEYEAGFLEQYDSLSARTAALELIGLYHLTRAAEVLAHYVTDGVVEGRFQIHQLLEASFDRLSAVSDEAPLIELEPMARLLEAAAHQMARNSIWSVTRAVNSKVTEFVRHLVARGRGDRAIFDVLPPQRRTLAEKGLLGSSRRAVVVSLPTSSGKTLIAQFRILQALNQFEADRGWVAYLAPTRALVSQITRQLRRDFNPLDIAVEQVSPALDVDGVEAELLQFKDPEESFRVLVTTPEKLDLMLRQGWEERIGRPLTLVVVDEAHNIQAAGRGLKLELLLSTINNECRSAQFLLLTPFISNAREVARWLGGENSDDISFAVDWQPNDRIVGVVEPKKGKNIRRNSYEYSLRLETIQTTRQTLVADRPLRLPACEEIAPTFSKVRDQSTLAAVTAQSLEDRGPVIVMHARPDWVWSLANKLKTEQNRREPTRAVKLVQEYLALEFGPEFELIELLNFGVGVHHGGLSHEVRALMEWLFEREEIRFMVATTTIAQGVNFPISGVVLASHQYPGKPPQDMSAEDFWNIAGRAGRVSQDALGVVALVARDPSKAETLRKFIRRQTGELNSALFVMASEAQELLGDLGALVYHSPEWSSFLQYLAHSYRQQGQPDGFADDIEQVLRGTFGFDRLRAENRGLSNLLMAGVLRYAERLEEPGQPLALVDSTGFSLESVRTVLSQVRKVGLNANSWNEGTLFRHDDPNLRGMMGVLLRVPELRDNLNAVLGGETPDGEALALILKDWVSGASLPDIARRHFLSRSDGDFTKALTVCGQNLFGRLTHTTSWGLGALLSVTTSDLPEERLKLLRNLPSRVFYGVNDDGAVALRLLGVPRGAAPGVAAALDVGLGDPLPSVRAKLGAMSDDDWQSALGGERGSVYRSVWRTLEGLD